MSATFIADGIKTSIRQSPGLFARMMAFSVVFCVYFILSAQAVTAQETFQDQNKTCTMKIMDVEVPEGNTPRFLVGIICEKRKVLSFWECPEAQGGNFSAYVCTEKKTHTVETEQVAPNERKGRELRIYAPSKERVPYVLCGKLCDPIR